MNSFGKSIRIFLKDGSVTGIKFGEVVNQTIQSISSPRLKFAELNEYTEAKRPGVYFLLGEDEDTGEPMAYIGEAENVYSRLQSHLSQKVFWSEVILIVSKDENLTKGHVKYLESRLIQMAFSANRYKIENYNQSQMPSLPMADKSAMEEFLVYIRLLVGVLGHKLLEELATVKVVTNGNAILSTNSSIGDSIAITLSVSGINANGLQTNEGIVVLEGSEAAFNIRDSLTNGQRNMRQRLIDNGSIVLSSGKYIFQKDVLFDTPSQSAAIIAGFSINGQIYWKDGSGKTLKEIENNKIG